MSDCMGSLLESLHRSLHGVAAWGSLHVAHGALQADASCDCMGQGGNKGCSRLKAAAVFFADLLIYLLILL